MPCWTWCVTLVGVGESTLEGDIFLQAAAVPHLHRLIITGSGEEEAVGGHSQLVHPLSVFCKVGYQDALGVPGGLGDRPSAHRPCLRWQACRRQVKQGAAAGMKHFIFY